MKIFSILFFACFFNQIIAQNIGIGTNNPNSSAALDIHDTARGLLIPRMTMEQRGRIINPANGLLIYQTDSVKGFWYNRSGQWSLLTGSTIFPGISIGEMLYWNGNQWTNVTPGNHGDGLYFCNGIPTWGGCRPLITTTQISAITATSAISGGIISDSGNAPITSRGICWSTTQNPTIFDFITQDSLGVGAFTSSLLGLTPSTQYYVRAYATNRFGTAYGNQYNFTTLLASIPTIKTVGATAVNASSAVSGGIIINDGGDPIIFKGVCWSTAPNPTISLSTKTVDGSGAGNFVSNLTSLTPNTLYHIRAYAVNSYGTAYGGDSTFRTEAPVVNLPSITLCNQIWTLKNLDVSTYRNGDVIPQVADSAAWANLTTGAWCWYKNDSATYAAIYGKLYNWYAVNDPRGLAPSGWHVPSHYEWNLLAKCIDPNADTAIWSGSQSAICGGAMKEAGTAHWKSPNTGATNNSGFTGLPGNFRNSNGSFFENANENANTNNAYWWSTTKYSYYIDPFTTITTAIGRALRNDLTDLIRTNTVFKHGYSVRCVKNQ